MPAGEGMSLERVSAYLSRGTREIEQLVERGIIPGRKVFGRWRFNQRAVNEWIDTNLAAMTSGQLAGVEVGTSGPAPARPLVAPLLMDPLIALPLKARTKGSAVRELVQLATKFGRVAVPSVFLAAVLNREQEGPTAVPGGVAVLHPHCPLTDGVAQPFVAFGRLPAPLPFGAPDRRLTDLVFLVYCPEPIHHLAVLVRLARLFRQPTFPSALRASAAPEDVRRVIAESEDSLFPE